MWVPNQTVTFEGLITGPEEYALDASMTQEPPMKLKNPFLDPDFFVRIAFAFRVARICSGEGIRVSKLGRVDI
jgi:hypothetical protein